MDRPLANLRSTAGLPTGRLAVWWILGSEIVIFGGLLAAYVVHRLGHPEWQYQAAVTSWKIGAFNTLVLLSSSLSAVLAHREAELGNGKKAAKLLLLTIGGGGLFLVVKAFEWTYEIKHGFTITSNTFWSFYYTAAGLHALHVIAGMVCMAFVAVAATKGRDLHRVELVGIYWHFVDVVWIFLFPLLYIAK